MAEIKYHISLTTGSPNRCYAKEGNCPLKSDDGSIPQHYATKEDARAGFEKDHSSETLVSNKKSAPAAKTAAAPAPAKAPAFVASEELQNDYKSVYRVYSKADQATVEKLFTGKPVKDAALDNFLENNRESLIRLGVPSSDSTIRIHNAVKEARAQRNTPSTLTTSHSFDPAKESVFSNAAARTDASVMSKSLVKELKHGEWMRELQMNQIDYYSNAIKNREGQDVIDESEDRKEYYGDEIKRSDARLNSMLKEVAWLQENSPEFKASMTASHRQGVSMLTPASNEDLPVGSTRKVK